MNFVNLIKMVKKGLPDRWINYQPLGKCISGTQIIAFKVPLKPELCRRTLEDQEKWFTPAILLEHQPNLKTVVDLTNTNRYYNPETEFCQKGVDHVKIMVEGRGTLPSPSQLQKFFKAVDGHMEKNSANKDALIGVHCTHGLNRTGYFVCRYLVDRLKMTPEEAIDKFNSARGHPIERQHLIDNLKGKRAEPHARAPKRIYQKDTTNYISPLSSAYEEYNYYHYDHGNSSTNYGYSYNRNDRCDRSSGYDRHKRGRYSHQMSRADLDKNSRSRRRRK